jgi:hypothetical protein
MVLRAPERIVLTIRSYIKIEFRAERARLRTHLNHCAVHSISRARQSERRRAVASKDKGKKEVRKPKTSTKKKEKAAPVIQSRVKEPAREAAE